MHAGNSAKGKPVPEALHVMGIDIGAGSLKATVIDAGGHVKGNGSAAIVTATPYLGWTEQDPEDWYRATCLAVPQALAHAGLTGEDVRAVSFSAGAHTAVLLDEADCPLRPAILWSDQRSLKESRSLRERHGEEILEIGFNQANPTWTLPQLDWLTRHEPEVVARTRRVMIAKDYLRFRLSGTWHTDRTEAVGTLLYDCKADAWSERLTDLIGWSRETLPPLIEPTAEVGCVSAQAAQDTGLSMRTRVICGTSDTSAEAYGAGAVQAGAGTVKLATAGTVSVIADGPTVHDTLINYPFAVPGRWYTIAGTNSCASAHKWLRDRVLAAGEDSFGRLDDLAGTVPAGSQGLLFHPYLNGERSPHWDPLLRADFLGLTMTHGQGHLVRALYEGVAYSLRDCLGALRGQGLDIREARIVGGGARSALWRQIVCDVVNLPLALPEVTDASFGAALLAGVGSGVFESEEAAAEACVRFAERHDPDPSRAALYDEMFELYGLAQSRLADINHRLGELAGRGVA